MRCGARSHNNPSLSSDSARCAPRFVGTSDGQPTVADLATLATSPTGGPRTLPIELRGVHDVLFVVRAAAVRAVCRHYTANRGPDSQGSSVAPSVPFAGAWALIAARMPCSNAVGVGGHPGISTSTGMTLATRPRLA